MFTRSLSANWVIPVGGQFPLQNWTKLCVSDFLKSAHGKWGTVYPDESKGRLFFDCDYNRLVHGIFFYSGVLTPHVDVGRPAHISPRKHHQIQHVADDSQRADDGQRDAVGNFPKVLYPWVLIQLFWGRKKNRSKNMLNHK